MSIEYRHFAVDRIEKGVAVLLSDSGRTLEIGEGLLPEGAREGSVIRVAWNEAGEIDWNTAEIDEAERDRRLSEAHRVLDELKKRDPGGDIDL